MILSLTVLASPFFFTVAVAPEVGGRDVGGAWGFRIGLVDDVGFGSGFKGHLGILDMGAIRHFKEEELICLLETTKTISVTDSAGVALGSLPRNLPNAVF